MRKLIGASLLTTAALAVPSSANAFFNVGFNCSPQWTFTNTAGSTGSCCGPFCSGDCPAPFGAGPSRLYPWYQYWPYEAHFQMPAPTKFPFWPPPMTAGLIGVPYPPMPAPGLLPKPLNATPTAQPAPAAQPPAPVQPIGFYHQAPSYWYQR